MVRDKMIHIEKVDIKKQPPLPQGVHGACINYSYRCVILPVVDQHQFVLHHFN